MKAAPAFGLLFALLAVPEGARAAIGPSFYLDMCAWSSTHIVVVSEGNKIDGEVEVLESWKGDLKKGERITVPELAVFAPEKERTIAAGLFGEKTNLPPAVTCSRMVLFLVRQDEKWTRARLAKTKWLPANTIWKKMQVSAVWVEGNRTFAFVQQMNPGPTELVLLGTEDELKRSVDDYLVPQTTLEDAIRLGDAKYLAKVVPPLLQLKNGFLRHKVIGRLRVAGKVGLPALRDMLRREDLLDYHGTLIQVLTEVGGVDAGADLTEVLGQELAFWKTAGPKLPPNWKDRAVFPAAEANHLWTHHNRARDAIQGLAQVRYAGSRDVLAEFRDHWRSLPRLAEFSPLDQSCDAALESVRRGWPMSRCQK